MNWQPIETAPKGVWAELRTDPEYAESPRILILFEDGAQSVCYWDWYYAKGGMGCTDGCAWIEPCSGEQANNHYGDPVSWRPLPDPSGTDLQSRIAELERIAAEKVVARAKERDELWKRIRELEAERDALRT